MINIFINEIKPKRLDPQKKGFSGAKNFDKKFSSVKTRFNKGWWGLEDFEFGNLSNLNFVKISNRVNLDNKSG